MNLTHRKTILKLPELLGSDFLVETLNGERVKYLNLDNAATTPTFKAIYHKLEVLLCGYGSIHRGSGIKSQISTAIFEESISIILRFLGVTPEDYAVIFTQNTTSAINKLSRMLMLSPDDTVFVSEFEHSANDLPWRKGARIVHIPADSTGQLDLDYLDTSLKNEKRGRKLVAISGASNITGALTPIHEIAICAHAHNAHLMIDAAQLVAHREINLIGKQSAEQIDFISFSGHKMYAPFGGGVLIGRRDLLEKMVPDDIGGGSVDFVTHDSYDLAADLMKRSTAGTSNVIGLASIALACEILKNQTGFNAIIEHEQAILDRAGQIIPRIKNMETYCDLDYDAKKKCAILTFNLKGVHPALVAARLGHEFGIGVRQGAICQFLYVAKLLGLGIDDVLAARKATLSGQTDRMYGIVRASFGLENTVDDVDRFAEALIEIGSTPEKNNNYVVNSDGELWPKDKPKIDVSNYFNLEEI